jgi:uncharacterized protein YjaZ
MSGSIPVGVLALASAAALVLGCGGSDSGSPTQPTPAPSAGNIVRFDDSGGALREHEASIRQLIESTSERVSPMLTLSGVTINVIPSSSRAIGGYGVGGFTPTGSLVEIYIDPSFANLAQVLHDRVSRLTAHELHHAKRWRGPGYGRTLREAIVSEGLADHFSEEVFGPPVQPWSDAFPREDTARYFDVARPELGSSSYDHDRWFFNASATLPRWTGYTLGYRLIETYKSSRPGTTAALLVSTPATDFGL